MSNGSVGTGEFTRALAARREAGQSLDPSTFPVNAGLYGGGGSGNYAGEALLATSAISQMVGSVLSANAALEQSNAVWAAARYNALRAEQQGRAEEARQRHIARRALSSQFVQMAGKSGVIAEEGGWLEALVWNAAEYEVNALNAAIAGRNTARLERARGEAAKEAGKRRYAAEMISGVGKLVGTGLSLAIGGSYPTVATTPASPGSAPA